MGLAVKGCNVGFGVWLAVAIKGSGLSGGYNLGFGFWSVV